MKFWHLVAICILVGLLAGFSWLTLNNRLTVIDRTIISAVYSRRSSGLTTVMNAITLLGNQALYLASVTISVFLIAKKRWSDLGWYLLLMIGQEVVNSVFKLAIARPRPNNLSLVYENSFSFPSGHSMAAFVFYSAAAIWLWRKGYGGKYRWTWFVAATMIILAVGLSRIYLGVHYPTDVFAGFLTGAIWILLVLMLAYKAS